MEGKIWGANFETFNEYHRFDSGSPGTALFLEDAKGDFFVDCMKAFGRP
jgi:hypothetical protein